MKKINEGFVCKHCGFKNGPAEKTCRNHCAQCLYSMHIDKDTPGDRKSACGSMMIPFSIDKSGKKGIMITHKCLKCGKISRNKTADDDNMEKIIEVSTYGIARINKK